MFDEQDKIITAMAEMSKEEIARFVMQGLYWIRRIAKEEVE